MVCYKATHNGFPGRKEETAFMTTAIFEPLCGYGKFSPRSFNRLGIIKQIHTSLNRRKDTRPVKFLPSFKVALLELMDFPYPMKRIPNESRGSRRSFSLGHLDGHSLYSSNSAF